MKKPLSKGIRTFYGLGDMGFGLMTSVELYYFVFFMTNVAKFSLPMVALIGSITSIADTILSPFYGAIISGTKALKWGRNRSWMLLAPPFVVVLYMFQFTKIGPDPLAAAIVCAGFILSHISWNIAWVGNVSLIPTLANNPQERGFLASRRGAYTSMAGVVFSYMALPIINFYNKITNSTIMGYTLLAGTMAAIMMIGYWIVFKLTEGYEPTGNEESEAFAAAPKAEKAPAGVLLKSVFQNPPLLVMLLADFFRMMPMFIATSAMAYYFTYVAQNMALMPLLLLINSLCGVLGAYLSGFVTKKFSNKVTAVTALFTSFVLANIARLVAMNVVLFMTIMPINGIIAAIGGAAWVAMYSDITVYNEWKTGKNASAFIMGLMTLPLKAAIISRGVLIPIVLAAAGFVAGVDPKAATQGLKDAVVNVYVFIPSFFTLTAALIATFGYRLSKEKLARYENEINARKSGLVVELADEKGKTL